MSPETDPIDSLPMLMAQTDYFALGAPGAALKVVSEVMTAVANWRAVATAPEAGLGRA